MPDNNKNPVFEKAQEIGFLKPNQLDYLRCFLLHLIEKYEVDLDVAHKELAELSKNRPSLINEALAVSIVNHHKYSSLFREVGEIEINELNKWSCFLENIRLRRSKT